MADKSAIERNWKHLKELDLAKSSVDRSAKVKWKKKEQIVKLLFHPVATRGRKRVKDVKPKCGEL